MSTFKNEFESFIYQRCNTAESGSPEQKALFNKAKSLANTIKEKLGDHGELMERLEEINSDLYDCYERYAYKAGFIDGMELRRELN